MTTAKLTVFGHPIPDSLIERVTNTLMRRATFRSTEARLVVDEAIERLKEESPALTKLFNETRHNEHLVYRITDKLLRRMREADAIAFINGRWVIRAIEEQHLVDHEVRA